MRVFVTGSTGLLGNNLIKLLVREGFEVKALARSALKAERQLEGTGAKMVVGDLADIDAFAHELEGCDMLFHTAAYFRESFQSGNNHWPMLEAINLSNTLRLFELAVAKGVSKIVHVSSVAALHKRPNGQLSDESDMMLPEQALTPYARSKVMMDHEISRRGLPVVTVMPGWMFGPGDAAPTGSGKFVMDYLNQRISGVFDSGIDIVDARDVALGMLAAAVKGQIGQRYILSGQHTSLSELCRILEQVSGAPAPKRSAPKAIIFATAWISERWASLTKKEADLTVDTVRVLTEKKRLSSEKAKGELQIAFRPLAETMRDTVLWFRAHKPDEVPKARA